MKLLDADQLRYWEVRLRALQQDQVEGTLRLEDVDALRAELRTARKAVRAQHRLRGQLAQPNGRG